MSKKLVAQDVVAQGKAGDKFISNNGVTIDVVSVTGESGTQERRYKRSYPADAAPIGKALFLELFNFKSFTRVEPSTADKGKKS